MLRAAHGVGLGLEASGSPASARDFDLFYAPGQSPDQLGCLRVEHREAVHVPRELGDHPRQLAPIRRLPLWREGDEGRRANGVCQSPTAADFSRDSAGYHRRDQQPEGRGQDVPATPRSPAATWVRALGVEQLGDRTRVGRTIQRRFGQAALAERQHRTFDRGPGAHRDFGAAVEADRPPLRSPAEEDLVQDDAEGPDVRADGGWLSCQNLRRHVVGRADEDRDPRGVGRVGRQAKVGEDQPAVLHSQEVVRLEVSVDDPCPVQRRQPGDHRLGVRQAVREWPRRRQAALQLLAQGAALGQLHGQELVSVGLADVEDAADVPVLNRSRQAQLAGEALVPFGIARQLGLEHLQSDHDLRGPIEHPQDDAAAALPDDLLDLIALREDGAALDVGGPLADERFTRDLGHAVLGPGPRAVVVRRLPHDARAKPSGIPPAFQSPTRLMGRQVSRREQSELGGSIDDRPHVRCHGRVGVRDSVEAVVRCRHELAGRPTGIAVHFGPSPDSAPSLHRPDGAGRRPSRRTGRIGLREIVGIPTPEGNPAHDQATVARRVEQDTSVVGRDGQARRDGARQDRSATGGVAGHDPPLVLQVDVEQRLAVRGADR